MMFTRTISTFKVTALALALENGKPVVSEIGSCTFVGTNATKADGRKALKANGFTIPRGTEILIETVSEQVYGCTVEDFMAIAKPIERKATDSE